MDRLAVSLAEPSKASKDISEVSSLTSEDSTLRQYDDTFLKECGAEVDQEMDTDQASAKVQEIQGIVGKEYQPFLQHEAPLEVRMDNVTYTVPVDEESNKIMTVYNSSFLYPTYKALRRIWKGEKREKEECVYKNILADINLVLKPGRQYLILGAPGSGKSTLLKAISGRIHAGKKETLSGSIIYNGRTLEVCMPAAGDAVFLTVVPALLSMIS